jgi:uncharacterized protein (TIGR02687 family)
MSELDQVARLLAERFSLPGERGRIVFWHDEQSQYEDDIEHLAGPDSSEEALKGVRLLRVANNPFNLKYQMLHEEPSAKFLVYVSGVQLSIKDNWLLDMELAYGPAFSADKLTMISSEVLPEAAADIKSTWLKVMRSEPKFFDSAARTDKLAALLNADDDENIFQAKMISVLLGLKQGKHSLQDIWRKLLEQYSNDDGSGIAAIERMGLAKFHWDGTCKIYGFTNGSDDQHQSTVKDFVLWLFRLAWHDFVDSKTSTVLLANMRRDFDSWYKDFTFKDEFKAIANDVADELMLGPVIADMSIEELEKRDLFREVDEALTVKLYEQVGNRSISDDVVQRIIANRRMRLWFTEFENDYSAIAAASFLYKELDECTPLINSIIAPEQGFSLYRDRLFKVDQAYRRFVFAWKKADSQAPAISSDLENLYASFQRSLGTSWQKQIDSLNRWALAEIPAQQDFYQREVQPIVRDDRKIAVIVSDALRFEVGEEFAERITTENRFTASVDAQAGVLPSYTQLGMAALLPHKTLALSPEDHYKVLIDGRSSAGTNNRNAILASSRGKAIQAEDLLSLSGSEARELVKSCNALYVYHNQIDAQGDNAVTESDTFEACEKAVEELLRIVKKLANANVSNMIVTADHGFLYQDHDVEEAEWLSEQPQGDAVWVKKRRFSVGSNLVENRALTTFKAAQLGLSDPEDEGVTVQIPNSIYRFRKQGTGVRYVHGGAALPEIVVPVIRVNKGRSASGDKRLVDFQILQKTNRLSSGQLTVELVQNEPVGKKVLPRTLLAGLWGHKNGENILISNETPVALNLTSSEKSELHVFATLMLTSDAEQFNGSAVELRLRERISGSNQFRMLDTLARYSFNRGIVADDDFDFN